jgi:DNA-binding response OmpR family regulator
MNQAILIAEHDVGLGQALKRCFGVQGFEATVASNGLECIDQLRTKFPSILVLDPGILWGGGAGVLEWLIQEEPTKVPRIVIVEDQESTSLPDTLVESFIHSQIRRPHELNDLLPFVRQIEDLAGSRPDVGKEPVSAQGI